ncbi:MAG TPA: sigma-54 dependent transcriptional regulator [Planctomycetota bacterium]|nr:sigma-54 dependent transcriptional regulator [Planctomycetota bacterium]
MNVLVIDDEKHIRTTLALCLEGLGCRVSEAPSAEMARAAVRRQPFDLAFLDLRLGESSGLDLLPDILSSSPACSIIVITAYAAFDTAVEAIKRGAKDYLPKPFTPAQITHIVDRIRGEQELRRRVLDLESRLEQTSPEIDLDSQSPKMRSVMETVARAAETDAALLLRGENGTGKGLLARAIHRMSPRRSQPFVVVNCPTLSEELLASELFGHAKGAFTGAVADRAGRVESANYGTLFLDELGELPRSLQVKLLRFLQEKTYERVGENQPRQADVRVIAATNRDLEAEIQAGRFREDLFFRLNVVEIVLPPLRERPEDILRLARQFLGFFARTMGRAKPELSKAAEEVLFAYAWPGNIRELRNAIERAAILWPAQVIEPQAFPERISGQASPGPRLGGDSTIEEIEREHIQRILERAPSLEEAARILGIDESTLWRKRKKFEK